MAPTTAVVVDGTPCGRRHLDLVRAVAKGTAAPTGELMTVIATSSRSGSARDPCTGAAASAGRSGEGDGRD
jgi:hypothetical protein